MGKFFFRDFLENFRFFELFIKGMFKNIQNTSFFEKACVLNIFEHSLYNKLKKSSGCIFWLYPQTSLCLIFLLRAPNDFKSFLKHQKYVEVIWKIVQMQKKGFKKFVIKISKFYFLFSGTSCTHLPQEREIHNLSSTDCKFNCDAE